MGSQGLTPSLHTHTQGRIAQDRPIILWERHGLQSGGEEGPRGTRPYRESSLPWKGFLASGSPNRVNCCLTYVPSALTSADIQSFLDGNPLSMGTTGLRSKLGHTENTQFMSPRSSLQQRQWGGRDQMPAALHLKWDNSKVCSTLSPRGPNGTEASCPWQQPAHYLILCCWLPSLLYLTSLHLCQCFLECPQTFPSESASEGTGLTTEDILSLIPSCYTISAIL